MSQSHTTERIRKLHTAGLSPEQIARKIGRPGDLERVRQALPDLPDECDDCGCCHCGGDCDGEHDCFAAGCECTRSCPQCEQLTGWGTSGCADRTCHADRLEREARDV